MSAKKVNLYLSLVFVAALGLSLFILRYASNWLTQSSQELISLRAEVAGLNTKQADLDKAKKALADNAAELDTLSKVLPEDKDQARVIQEIYALADQANITIDSVSFPSSTLGAATAPKPATTTETLPAGTTSSEAAPAPVKSVSQATPLKEIPGVQSIELSIGTITSKDASIKGVRYEEMMKLIKLIERNRRTLQIRSIGIGQNANTSGAPTYNLSLSLVIFIQP